MINSTKNVKVGIIGIGNMGSAHIKYIFDDGISNLELVAVADINPDRLIWAKEKMGDNVKCYSSADELLDSANVDAVIIATPHYDHPTIAIKALKKNINVLCEKPAGVYTKQVRAMNEVAQQSDAVFAVMFNQRTNPIYKKMHEIVVSGEMGEIKRTSWIITNWYRPQSYYNSGGWRATWSGEGGGVLINQCPHNLDLWQWICGMPSKVTAFCHEGKWHDIEVEDDVTAYVEYPNGATGTFITTTADYPGTNRFEITLDGGKLICDGEKLTMYKLKTFERDFNAGFTGGFGDPEMEFIGEIAVNGDNSQHKGVLEKFSDAITKGTPLVAEGIEGIKELTISNAMHLSSWLNTTIELPFDEELFYQELQKKVMNSSHKKQVKAVVFDLEKTYNNNQMKITNKTPI